jgi:hypothetical protein
MARTAATSSRDAAGLPLAFICCLIALGVTPSSTGATPSCSADSVGWCVARRIDGSTARGGLGFRFGEPLDVDGDGRADIAVGARLKLQKTMQNGSAGVWSGATGELIREWDGEWKDGLFGHWVMPVPDLSGDGLADLIIAAPHGTAYGRMGGVVVARSPKTGAEIWQHAEPDTENLGWDLTLAGDQDGDGLTDLFVGAPGEETSRVYLLSGKDGSVLRTYAPAGSRTTFGWYVARLDDLDGDGRPDLAAGAPTALDAKGVPVGGAWVFSAASGKELRHWTGTDPRGGFGSVVAPVPDLDGDGKGEIAVAAPGTEDQTRTIPGELRIYSTATGKALRHWSGTHPGELYGRMIVAIADLDGDGVEDLAIGAPTYRRGEDDRVGRVELRSGRSGKLLTELFGDGANCWFGWHIRRAPDPEGRGRPAMLISSIRHPVGDKVAAGVLDLYVLHPGKGAGHHGTISRGARRSDIK